MTNNRNRIGQKEDSSFIPARNFLGRSATQESSGNGNSKWGEKQSKDGAERRGEAINARELWAIGAGCRFIEVIHRDPAAFCEESAKEKRRLRYMQTVLQ